MLSRRRLLKAALAAGVFGGAACRPERAATHTALPGGMAGHAAERGHRLREGSFAAPQDEETTDIAIIGGGVAGLAAARQIHKAGTGGFRLLELEDQAGGNADYGVNDISAYPWAAHYLPIPGPEATEVRELLEELGAITGWSPQGLPLYDETMLCADPEERLFRYGRWQDGIIPVLGLTPAGEAEHRRFFARMEELRHRAGRDGKRLFAIPLDRSSADEEWRALDAITMAAWLEREGYRDENLLWYVNYACRDDYGTRSDETSAWAGIHYFASRLGLAANAGPQAQLTWPEGNGWLASRLAAPVQDRITTGAVAFGVTPGGEGVAVDYWRPATNTCHRLQARAAIMAVPQFVAARLLAGRPFAGFSYAPWAVANVTLDRLPEGTGAELSWDNVNYNSQQLGYVVATHQNLHSHPMKTVLTCYWPLSHTSPAEARREALDRGLADWQALFVGELLRLHPELAGHIRRCDVRLFGHAMVRPTPGFLWGRARQAAAAPRPPLFFAHSDLSGISVFEEAYTRGQQAARDAAAFLRGRP